MFEAYLGGAFVTGIWFMFKTPPRTVVEAAVTIVAIALWPALYAYAIYLLFVTRETA